MIKICREKVLYIMISVIIGIVVALIEVLFVKGITLMRSINAAFFPLFTFALPIIGVILIIIKNIFNHFSEDVGYGMSYVFDVGQSRRKDIPVLLIPFSLIATFLSQLGGASVGKEGMAVQLGATAANFIGKRFNYKRASEVFTIAGIAAGFSGLFLKPIAAICFALEVLVCAELKLYALVPTIIASVTSYLTARHFVGEGDYFNIEFAFNYEPKYMWKLIVLGIVFGIAGLAFSYLLKATEKFFKRLKGNVYILTLVFGVVTALLIIFLGSGRYSGTGSELIYEAFNDPDKILPYDFIAKMLFTVVCLAIGFKGGEVTPLFTIGATLGVILGKALDLPTPLTSALGYAAVFGVGTNTYFCPIIIGLEVFGSGNLPLFFIVCSIAYLFNFNKSIYSKQDTLIKD